MKDNVWCPHCGLGFTLGSDYAEHVRCHVTPPAPPTPPPPATEDFCDSCGHSEYDHVTEEDNAYCLGGLAGEKGCRCSEFRPKDRGITCVMITADAARGEEG